MFCGKWMNSLINKMHKRCLSTVLNDFISPYNVLLNATGEKSLHFTNLYRLVVEVFKSVNQLNPKFMNEMFVKKPNNYNLRSGQTFQIPPNKTTRGINSAIFRGILAWNMLPQSIKNTTTLTSFKDKVKNLKIYCQCSICK